MKGIEGMINEDLDKVTDKDLFTMVFFALYKLKDDMNYATLSKLSFLLDKKSLLNLVECFGGMTITIPTMKELSIVLNALLLYSYVDIEHIDESKALRLIANENNNVFSMKEIKSAYTSIKEILSKYDFSRD